MNVNSVARVASLVGEPARTAMLLQLMDGRALTAKELARAAGVSPATGSRHLALMVQAELLALNAAIESARGGSAGTAITESPRRRLRHCSRA